VPTYQYRCTDCGEPLEAVQSFTDDPLTECPACRGTLRKVFSSVGIVFKGSGFYRTDSRAAEKEKAAATSGGAKGDGASDSKKDAKNGSGDAAKPAAKEAGSSSESTTGTTPATKGGSGTKKDSSTAKTSAA
jgi:putative FmdB family regulatory protein